ncbi:hypothetical protein B0J18DRAFT_249511 [Chaetomium sp. MPI-SDFR-AT-0129]|nr:hypothetical protein B0J18DRAFT_249511 [Chaetomium sp. MPI-SDFR-AT-0129]
MPAAIPSSTSTIASPDVRTIVTPVLSALPGAAASQEPPSAVLPSLSPILRQRVQLLSSSNAEPWIRLLSYDPTKVAQLTSIAQSGDLDPHPVSGEIEVDWDYDIDTTYKRLDQETLQALVVLKERNLFFRLVYCTGDPDGGGDGWRVGEVGVADSSTATNTFGGASGVVEAETLFQAAKSTKTTNGLAPTNGGHTNNASKLIWGAPSTTKEEAEEEDDDDDYWARYDATPSRTPAVKSSPAPRAAAAQTSQPETSTEAEDAYFSQYDSVQPAMDNHDPDEEAAILENPVLTQRPLGLGTTATAPKPQEQPTDGPVLAHPVPRKPESVRSAGSRNSQEESWVLANPTTSGRPGSAGSNSSQTVARLEEAAESREQTEFGVKQHISRSIRSLFLLSRASGIDREEFESMVRRELDVLGMVETDI